MSFYNQYYRKDWIVVKRGELRTRDCTSCEVVNGDGQDRIK